jgi:integrase
VADEQPAPGSSAAAVEPLHGVVVSRTDRFPGSGGGPAIEPDEELSAGAAERIERALADSSRTAYERHWRAFARWCWLVGRTAMPATAQTLATYLDHLSRQPTERGTPPAPQTLANVLGSLQAVHKAAGEIADVRLARAVLKDYRRERHKAGHRTRKAEPITASVLRRVLVSETLAAVGEGEITPLRGLHTQVALVLGLALAGRSSEISQIDIEDIAFEALDGPSPDPGGDLDDDRDDPDVLGLDVGTETMRVRIGKSKTDQRAVGTEVVIGPGKHLDTCPVRVTQMWIDTLAAHGITSGPLIRGLDRYGRLAGTSGYAGRIPDDGVPRITNNALNSLVRTAVSRARDAAVARDRRPRLREPAAYSWHSLRAGLATSAGQANIPPSTVAERGRWKGLLMVMTYWRDGAARRRRIEQQIGL